MADYNNSALLGGGFDFNNFLTNPLTLAGLQMLSNNSPRVGQPVNTFSGVAEIVGNAAAAQRKQQEAAAGQAAISAALQNAGFSQAEADMYAKNPEAAKIALGEKKRKDELRQQNEAWEQYKAFDQPETPPAAFDQPDVWDSVPNPLDKDQSRFNQSAAEPQAELADQLADMGRKYTGAPLNQIIPEMANGNKTVAARMLAAAKASGLSPDARMTKEMLDDPETVIPLLRAAGVGAGTGEGGLEQAHAAAVDAAAQRRAALAEQYAALPSGTATDAPYSENAEEPENEQQRPQFTQAEPSLGAALARVAQLQGGQGGQAQPDWMAGAQAQPMTTAPRQAAPTPQTRTEQALEARRDQELQNQIRKQQFLIARPGIPTGMKEAAKLQLQDLYAQQREGRKVAKPEFRQIGPNEYGFVNPATGEVTPYRSPKKEEAEDTKQGSKRTTANIVMHDLDRAKEIVKDAPLRTTGAGGQILQYIGGTKANDVRALVDSVKANIGFDRLQQMREQSPTGGALGQVAVEELRFLQSTVGNLEQSQTKEQFLENMARVKWIYNDIVNVGSLSKGGEIPIFKTIKGKLYVKQGDKVYLAD
jgi:hypothetical protein